MGHAAEPPVANLPRTALDVESAAGIAATLQALATPSRLLILARLREGGPLPATELAAAVGMEQSACSHQLRVLRHLGLVTGTRTGRSVIYALYDHHVAELLDQALHHAEHLRLGITDPPADRPPGPSARAGVRQAAATANADVATPAEPAADPA